MRPARASFRFGAASNLDVAPQNRQSLSHSEQCEEVFAMGARTRNETRADVICNFFCGL